MLAAKYKAWSEGDNGELAAAQARTTVAKSKEDEIEIAIDYILGRNGKPKDPKTGIRILYRSAKDKPIAQKVFVDRWSNGDLDGALEVLRDEEWQKILPWYKNAWDNGNKRVGLILGNDAYSRKQYSAALNYWQGSGLAKCWYLIGQFYAPWSEEGKGGGPSSMRDETKARKAYERSLGLDGALDDTQFALGLLYLFASKQENTNPVAAKRIFFYFMNKDSDDMWYNFYYGVAGCFCLQAHFDKKWPKDKVDTLISWAKRNKASLDYYARRNGELRIVNGVPRAVVEYFQMIEDWESMKRSQEEFVTYIRKASNLGCEPAQKFISKYEDKNQ